MNEDEAIVALRELTHNFGVHEVADSNEAGCNRRGDADVVEYTHEIDFRLSDIKPQRNHQPKRTAVGSKAGETGETPNARRVLFHRQDDFKRMGKKISGLVEEAVPEARADDDADETVEEERLKLVLRNFLLLVEVIGCHVGQRQTDAPTETVPTHAERSYAEGFHGGIPENHGNK